MTKFLILLLCSLSIVISGQNWKFESNPYNNPYRNPYDNTSSKAESDINRDMKNVKKIINSSTKIYEYFSSDNDTDVSVEEENNASAPGAPGEPVPIDEKIMMLFFAAIAIVIFYKKHLQKLIITNHKN